MMRKLTIALFIVAWSASSTMVLAASESLHFPVAAPAAAGLAGSEQKDDLRTGIKANGLGPIGSLSVDLVSGEAATVVTNKAAQAQCAAAFASPGATCTVFTAPATVCATGPACCDAYVLSPAALVNTNCTGTGGKGFDMGRAGGGAAVKIDATPAGAGGSVTHFGVENKNIYPDAATDPGARTLIQIRPGGLTGNITIRVFHTQAGANPRIATVVVNSTNNDPGEALALHNAIETALEGIAPALSPAIVATTHPLTEAIAPLTAFGFLKQASHFTDITNMAAVGITEVEIVVPQGMGFYTEASDNTFDQIGIPTLNEWGIVALVALLLLAGYMLRRRQRAGTATT
jgi:exosortase sorting signal-containing protein